MVEDQPSGVWSCGPFWFSGPLGHFLAFWSSKGGVKYVNTSDPRVAEGERILNDYED